MKCRSCDVILTDEEAVIKSVATGEYMDMCAACLSEIPEVKTTMINVEVDDILDDVEE